MKTVALIIPALNEELSIGTVINTLPKDRFSQIIVVDNGSEDDTARIAKENGAKVVSEPRQGYGQACLRGMEELKDEDIVLFMDADASDNPDEIPDLLAPIESGQSDFVIGSRSLGKIESGAMTPPQRFGNWLATFLIRVLWGYRYSDLGPFRAIRQDSLRALDMRDTNYGWTVEMQIKAIQKQLSIKEIPVSYRKRIGVSKISGTVKGVIGAGSKIIGTILFYRLNLAKIR